MTELFGATRFQQDDLDLIRAFSEVRRRSGKGLLKQLLEIWRLGRGRGKINPQEYFYYQLYDDEQFGWEDKLRFVGSAFAELLDVNDVTWFAPAHDKLLFHTLMRGMDLPTPSVMGVFAGERTFPGAISVRTTDDLRHFVGKKENLPFFAKPIAGMHSRGVAVIESFDAERDTVRGRGGEEVLIEALERILSDPEASGYLFQPLLKPHPEVEPISPAALATVRMVVALRVAGPQLVRALIKIPAGTNIADNFWRPGNMLGAIEHRSGTIAGVVRGFGWSLDRPTEHPDTGVRLVGRSLPDWENACDLCLTAASQFPGIRLQAWDVALSADGPRLVEVNIGGDSNLPQLAFGRGLLDDPIAELVRENSNPH